MYPALLQVSNEDVLAKICFPRALFSKRAQLKCLFETNLLTIGPQFGEDIDDATRYFNNAYDKVSLDECFDVHKRIHMPFD